MQSRTANTTLAFIQGHIGASDAAELGRAIQAMTDTEAWGRLMEFVDRVEADTSRELDQGPLTHDVYLYNHGRIRGIRTAREVVDGIIEAGQRAESDLEVMTARMEADDGRPD